MDTRKIHVRALSTISGIMQFEHEVQNIYFLGLEDFEGDVYISIESDDYSNEAIPLTNNTFIIGQPMTLYNTTYTCQIYGVVNNGEKIKLSKRFRLIVDKSNDIQGDSEEYPVDPNFTNGIIEFMNEQKEQVQSEIQATGEAVKASIPSDYSTLEQATYNAYPCESESGNPVYIDDGADDIPVKELIVNLEPKQEGSGDPSPTNVRAISGYDGVVVRRSNKNVIVWTRDVGYMLVKNGITFTVNSDYSVTVQGTATANTDLTFARTETLPNGTLYLNGASSSDCHIRWNITTNPADTGSGAIGFKQEGDNGNMYIRVLSGATVDTVVYPMVRIIESDTDYETPVHEEYSIAFPNEVGNVYGGTLNVTTGLLTIDRYNLWLDPTKIPDGYIHFDVLTNNARIGNLILTSHFGLTSAYNAKFSSEATFRNGALSNWSAERNKGYSSDTSGFYFSGADRFYLYCPKSIFASQDASGFKQYLTDNPLYICYELATPITYQLTPTEVSTLLGSNTIQSDGSMDLTYRADTTKVIEMLTNAIISMGGNV